MPHSHLLEEITSVIYSNVKSSFELKINTDSRNFKTGDTFVALVGDKFDGFNYVEDVLKHSPSCVVFVDKEDRRAKLLTWETVYPEINFITVTDTLIFLQDLATAHLKEWKQFKSKRKVIGITGSNGKTTHKEMVKYLLESIFPGKILATKGNLNNHIGVPLTLFNLSNEHDIAIIEMGMNHVGEIKELVNIALPEHGIITNIGAAHIEFMKTMENIFVEKSTLYKAVLINSKGEGMFVVNADDPYLNRLEQSNGLTTYGETNGSIKVKVVAPNISFNFLGKDINITNKNISEHHNLKNLAGTTIFCMKLFPDKIDDLAVAACSYEQPSMNRSQWINNIFLDAYNANPSSMRVSLNSFVEIIKAKQVSLDDCFFVLGDMNELGEFAEKLHKEIAEHVKLLGIKNVTFIGRYKDFYLSGYQNPTSAYLTKEDFFDEWKGIRKKYQFVFVKASRSLQLESLISIV